MGGGKKANTNLVQVSSFSALIRPSIFSPTTSQGVTLDEEGWKFFEQLTALQRSDLFDRGQEFAEVWKQFIAFVGMSKHLKTFIEICHSKFGTRILRWSSGGHTKMEMKIRQFYAH